MSTNRSRVGHDTGSSLIRMRVIRDSSEDEMIALFLLGELNSERFGNGIRSALDAASQTEALITAADLGDADQNRARRTILGLTRGYGENRDVFENFPARVQRLPAMLAPSEFARVRYMILAGQRRDHLICLEGQVRLTAYAVAGFASEAECLVGTARTMDCWDH